MPAKQLKTNQSVEKSFQIIEIMAREKVPMRLADIALGVGIPTSTALRMINTLLTLGYINQDQTTLRYSLSLKFAYIGNCVTSQSNIRDVAHSFLVELSRTCMESVCLAQEQDMEVVYIDVVDGPDNMLKITQYIGKRAPMHCTGVGKLLLLNYSDEQLKKFVSDKGLRVLTPNTISSYGDLRLELNQIRQRGYAIDDEECELGARCIAASITDYTGNIVCGLSLSGPISRMTKEHIEEIAPIVTDTAKRISKMLASDA